MVIPMPEGYDDTRGWVSAMLGHLVGTEISIEHEGVDTFDRTVSFVGSAFVERTGRRTRLSATVPGRGGMGCMYDL